MIVFDLRCGAGHVFESWFGSSMAYEDQRARGLLTCPLCGDGAVDKAVMAPNVGTKGNSVAAPSVPSGGEPTPAMVKAAMQVLARAQAKALEGSQWVGGAFADRARAMHSGEEDAVPIHGRATHDEARALVDEGVPVAPLPLPVTPPETLN